jgi:hypothetical protein
MSAGGHLVVFCVESRWVEMKADMRRESLVPALFSFLERGFCCASREAICRYFPQGEKWQLMKI